MYKLIIFLFVVLATGCTEDYVTLDGTKCNKYCLNQIRIGPFLAKENQILSINIESDQEPLDIYKYFSHDSQILLQSNVLNYSQQIDIPRNAVYILIKNTGTEYTCVKPNIKLVSLESLIPPIKELTPFSGSFEPNIGFLIGAISSGLIVFAILGVIFFKCMSLRQVQRV